MKIKLYRHTIETTEHLPPHLGYAPIITYQQRDWSSIKTLILRKDSCKRVVLIEEKEIEIES